MLGWESGGFGAAPAQPETWQAGWGALPTAPRSPPTLCFICLGHKAFWESSVCVRPKAAWSTKQLHSHIGLLGTSEISTRMYWLRQQHSPPLHRCSCVANTTQNLNSTSPDPKVPPKLPWSSRSWLWQKGSAAEPGRSTISDIYSNKGSNSFDCCGLLGLPEIVWWVCVCVCAHKNTMVKGNRLVLGWRVFIRVFFLEGLLCCCSLWRARDWAWGI